MNSIKLSRDRIPGEQNSGGISALLLWSALIRRSPLLLGHSCLLRSKYLDTQRCEGLRTPYQRKLFDFFSLPPTGPWQRLAGRTAVASLACLVSVIGTPGRPINGNGSRSLFAHRFLKNSTVCTEVPWYARREPNCFCSCVP